MIKAFAAQSATSKLTPFEFDPGALRPGQLEIKVEHCGVCHSDLSMAKNHWQMTQYPFVPGHEIVGTVSQVGEGMKYVKPGMRVGLGWFAGSCQFCPQCMSGNQNLCATSEQTIVGRHGGFASHVRCQENWVIPLPKGINTENAGPLFCGGITVFNPLVQFDVKPFDRVGVIGIGGLGHMALKFLRAWGCEVVAFTSTNSKADEAKSLGAHQVINSKSASDMASIAGSLNFILSTANADLDWQAIMTCLAPKGRLHFVGAVPNPVSLQVFPMIVSQASISATPLGSPATTAKMLEFCARHRIEPVSEYFKMSQVNEALEHLENGKARYRIILKNDL